MSKRLRLSILPQPDDTTCGPTCLQAVYYYLGDAAPLGEVIAGVRRLPEGGTLTPFLGIHALQRGYRVRIFVYDLRVFDPSWFKPEIDIHAKLVLQLGSRGGKRLGQETDAYLAYLANGGKLDHLELTPALLTSFLEKGTPIIAGLSATYLYGLPRERPNDDQFDDIEGRPAGHFVVLRGYDPVTRMVAISDPMGPGQEPLHPYGGHEYEISIERVIGAIMLGVLTRDANLLIVETSEDESGTASRQRAAVATGTDDDSSPDNSSSDKEVRE